MMPTRREFMISGAISAGATALPAVGAAQVLPGSSVPSERSRAIMQMFGLKYPIF